jgi:hypothetical protein
LTRKQKIAKFIEEHPKASFDEWAAFQRTVPEIRLKKGGKGVVLINLEGKSGFSDPKSWLANHRAGCVQRLERAVMDCDGILTRDDIESVLMALTPGKDGKLPDDHTEGSLGKEELVEVLLEHYKAKQIIIREYHEHNLIPILPVLDLLYTLTFNHWPTDKFEKEELWKVILEASNFGH